MALSIIPEGIEASFNWQAQINRHWADWSTAAQAKQREYINALEGDEPATSKFCAFWGSFAIALKNQASGARSLDELLIGMNIADDQYFPRLASQLNTEEAEQSLEVPELKRRLVLSVGNGRVVVRQVEAL